jgi:ATP-dependent DNA helicase RecG
MIELSTSVEDLTRVGKTTASRLKRLGLSTARDLIFHFPHRYEDWSKISTIAEIEPQQSISIQGKITKIKNFKSPRKRMQLTEAFVEDETGSIKVLWFNQGFLVKNLPVGTHVSLWGKTEISGNELLLKSPKYEVVGAGGVGPEGEEEAGKILPIYPLSMNLSQKQLQFLVNHVIPLAADLTDPLPEILREKENLAHLSTAIRWIHQPDSFEQIEKAKKRFAFEEVFYLQLQSAYLRKLNKKNKSLSLKFFEDEIKEFVASLPFELTDDQKKTAWKIFLDLEESHPMNRLVQGDVGSGKTVVAAMTMFNTSLNGAQSVILAPTEVLASQHFSSISKLFAKHDLPIAILTRTQAALSVKGKTEFLSKRKVIEQIQSGNAAITIGTHALLQPDIVFKQLGLAIIDEQHRFGVEQRKKLRMQSGDEQTIPHLLSMTATPIPRTLSLVFYGDLSVSSIRQMPKDRKPIQTSLVQNQHRTDAYAFIQKQLDEGDQAYVVCPLIEESDSLGVTSVTQEEERLKQAFPKNKIAILHGKMKGSEKEKVMQDFKDKKIDLLIATTVIEVGVDVPNATVMVIEGAERFGLSQLHQIRGRVGRGEKQSFCMLFPTDGSPMVSNRLQSFIACPDGFAISELDLQIRGGGEVLGTKQSGQLDFNFVDLQDTEFIEYVHDVAEKFLKDNKLEDFPLLLSHIEHLNRGVHLE